MSAGEFAGVGFAAGVVRGARSFQVDALGRLTGVHYKQVWHPGENEAECRKSDDDPFMAVYVRAMELYRPWTASTSTPSAGLVQVPAVAAEPKCDPPHQFAMCKCGFYAYYDGSDDYHQKGYVSGVVEGYGETLIGTRGFRAMKARIVALRIPKHVNVHLARLVARNYPDVPLFTSFDDMVTEFPPDGGHAELTPETDPEFWTRTI